MPSASSSISVDTVTLPSGSQLSILRHDRQPRVCWLSAMEVHAHVLCTNLHTLPRNVQLSRKASYRQDLTKLNLPYRIASREELNALKGAGVLSMQAPSSMLMRVEDALKLLKEKGKSKVRKEVKRKWREWTAGAAGGDKDDTKRGKENRAVKAAGKEGVDGNGSDSSDSKKGGRRQRKRATASEESDTEQEKSDEANASSSSGEEDDADDDDDDDGDDQAHNAARILSSHQFHLLWSTPISPPAPPPTPTPSSSPASSPDTSPSSSPATTPTPPLTSISTAALPSPLLPSFSPLAQLKKRPRKSSSPFSLSWSRWLGEAEVGSEAVSDSDDGEQKRRRVLPPPHSRLKVRSV